MRLLVRYVVQRLREDVFTPTLCKGGGVPATRRPYPSSFLGQSRTTDGERVDTEVLEKWYVRYQILEPQPLPVSSPDVAKPRFSVSFHNSHSFTQTSNLRSRLLLQRR